ncbi:MAG: tetratricopeptide repeat protein [Pontibacterium sp.]
MRWLMHLFAPLLFSVTYALFRSSLFKRSKKKHHLVMKLFRYAADNSHCKALSVYGHLLHFKGDGIQNRIQGGIYLQRAADKGDVKAQYQMGKIFESGYEHYFQADAQKALTYYRLAATQGHVLAINRLVHAYEKGELSGVIDLAESENWRNKLPALPAH